MTPLALASIATAAADTWVSYFPVTSGSRPHDVAPATEKFESFPSSQRGAQVRQMLSRPGEAWGAESGNDRLVLIKY